MASTRRSIAAGADVAARRTRRSRCAGWRARGAASASLPMSRIWPIEGLLGVGAEERVLPLASGRSRSTRAASSRRGSAWGRCAGRRGRPGGSRSAGAGRASACGRPRRPSMVPATTRAPFLSGLRTKSFGSRPTAADDHRVVGDQRELPSPPAAHRAAGATGWRTGAAWRARRRRGRTRRARLGRRRRRGRAARPCGRRWCGGREAARAAWRRVREPELAADLALRRAALAQRGVGRGDLPSRPYV